MSISKNNKIECKRLNVTIGKLYSGLGTSGITNDVNVTGTLIMFQFGGAILEVGKSKIPTLVNKNTLKEISINEQIKTVKNEIKECKENGLIISSYIDDLSTKLEYLLNQK